MTKHTVVIDFPGDEPAYSANMVLMGGRVVAVAFEDELERAMELELQRDELLEALEQAVTSMQDSGYPNSNVAVRAARQAISKAKGQQHD